MELIPIEILTKYPQICKEGAKIDGYNVRYIPSEVLKENIDIIMEGIHSTNIRSRVVVPPEIEKEHPEINVERVKYGKMPLYWYGENIEEIENQAVKEIIEENPEDYIKKLTFAEYHIENISLDLLNKYPDICIAYLKNGGDISEIPEEILQQHSNIYITYIKDGGDISRVPEDFLQQNSGIYLDYIKVGGDISKVPEDFLKEHPEVIIERIEKASAIERNKDGQYVKYIPKEKLMENPELCLEALSNGARINDVPEEILTNEFMKEYFRRNINEASYYPWDELNEIAKSEDGNIGPEWQEECFDQIKDSNNVILSSPTGSGKTNVFMKWATQKEQRPIYITAPIKALSNQRYRELKEQGLNVGLETGDIKNIPENCDFICCTQEIYTNKYAEQEDATLIIDEFHYIFENGERARAYIDALHNTKAKNVLLCSATMGDINRLKEYVDRVSDRDFKDYEGKSRLTELNYQGQMYKEDIRNALVITFTRNNIESILDDLQTIRADNDTEFNNGHNMGEIYKLYEEYKVKNNEILERMQYGLAGYYGGLLPKEKLFIEDCFEKGLIDTIVGTDALAMGVNFPVENVVFTQLAKYYDGPISKNLFDQIAGRAGRKGFFDEGQVYFCDDFTNSRGYSLEKKGCNTEDLYRELLFAPNEDISIELTPNIKGILQGKSTIEEEAEFISRFSCPQKDSERVLYKVNRQMDEIVGENSFARITEEVLDDMFGTTRDDDEYGYYDELEIDTSNEERNIKRQKLLDLKDEFYENLPTVYFDEYSPEKNCKLFLNILAQTDPEEIIYDYATSSENFYDMLQFRKYVKSLPKQYRKGLTRISTLIRDIDETALDEFRGSIPVEKVEKRLEQDGKLAGKNVMKVLKEQENSKKMQEREDIIAEQLAIAEKYGLEEY